ncbi:hypothetical protein SEA_SICARIUS2_61 [Arthrobacter phage Sicarius2]|uniref:Uncharacterized protein n=1 Tax=Arthrobacter phage Sicarius2 TaxID=2836090 RepID=A0A8F3IKE1_9CAUD|nr:hypothetical protein SEA_SICARIUS2_61 [Arthrobacter phage Sicarius2]
MPNVHMAAATLAEVQLVDTETAEVTYLSEEGLSDETMQFSALNRIAEAQLALAYEQRTANLIELLKLAQIEGWEQDGDGRMIRAQILEALDIATIDEIIDGRAGQK